MYMCMLTFLPQLILTHGDSIPLSCQQHYLQGTYMHTETHWSKVLLVHGGHMTSVYKDN